MQQSIVSIVRLYLVGQLCGLVVKAAGSLMAKPLVLSLVPGSLRNTLDICVCLFVQNPDERRNGKRLQCYIPYGNAFMRPPSPSPSPLFVSLLALVRTCAFWQH